MAGELTVLIENLSSDMGGLIRARDYVRLPLAVRENTIMIMLMNDREELADGSYLKEGTLYNQWGSEEHITDQAAIGMALLAKKVAPAMTAFGTGYAFESDEFYTGLYHASLFRISSGTSETGATLDTNGPVCEGTEQGAIYSIPYIPYRRTSGRGNIQSSIS